MPDLSHNMALPPDMPPSRRDVYYWKCDRPAAFHGVLRQGIGLEDDNILTGLREVLSNAFPGPIKLEPAAGEGTHRTYLLCQEGTTYFVRVEDGPDGDNHLAVESQVMANVAQIGVPVPRVFFTDASRRRVPFGVQVIEFFDCPDLNRPHREGRLPLVKMAEEIGRAVARWQTVPVHGFGPFDPAATLCEGKLYGYHSTYEAYFRLHLPRHLHMLEADGFLSSAETQDILRIVDDRAALLEFGDGCLVHKDLALWNILGTPEGIRAFIDWDDAIAGDPTDDLSLLACFHPANVVLAAVRGYEAVRPLPDLFLARFWLHMLRNMIVKSVIRCGAGYFKQVSGTFLIAPRQDGTTFRAFTRKRLFTAYHGLLENRPLSAL